jgi:hypothetical protein
MEPEAGADGSIATSVFDRASVAGVIDASAGVMSA